MKMCDNISRSYSCNNKYFSKVVENIKANILLRENIFSSEILSVYEVMWNKMVELDRPQMTIWLEQKNVICMPDNWRLYLGRQYGTVLPTQT